MGAWLVLLFLPLLTYAGDLPVDVDASTLRSAKLGISHSSFEELSAYLYGGDQTFATKLRELNGSPNGNRDGVVRYPLPRYRVGRGDTMQRIGGFWAGGSAFSYKKLLEINPQIRNLNSLEPGSSVYLPRIPTAEERAQWKEFWFANNEPNSAKAKIEEPAECASSPLEPTSDQERVALVRWYLERSEIKRDPRRADAIVRELLSKSKSAWNAHLVAGQYFLETGRPKEAAEHLEATLRDRDAPIQAGLYFLKARELAQRPLDPAKIQSLHKRYPQLRALLAEMSEVTPKPRDQ